LLNGKHILIGLTGSIAAYKAAVLVRLLVREGAEVKVIMTDIGQKVYLSPDNGNSFGKSCTGRIL